MHLEFKTLADQSGRAITKDDRRLLAKALCGMANAEGGLLLIGVATKKHDGLDVATELKAIEDIEALRNRVVSYLPDLLSPQHTAITVHGVRKPRGRAGCLAIRVPPSEIRPHMSLSEHRYFRRGSDGTRMMEHGEVRDLMLAPRQGVLDLRYFPSGRVSSGLNFGLNLMLSLSNVGRVPVRAPFLWASGSTPVVQTSEGPTFQVRTRPDGSIGFYSNRDTVVHVEDGINVALIKSGIHFHVESTQDLKAVIAHVRETKDLSMFSIRTWEDSLHNERMRFDRLVDVEVSFGGENTELRQVRLTLDKFELFELFSPIIEK